MKKGMAVVLALVLLLVAVTPALAEGPGPIRTRVRTTTFAVVGTVAAVDATEGTIEISVGVGNRMVRDMIGQTILVTVNEDTKIRAFGEEPGVFIELGDIEVDQTVSAGGVVVDGVNIARHVVVGVPFFCIGRPAL